MNPSPCRAGRRGLSVSVGGEVADQDTTRRCKEVTSVGRLCYYEPAQVFRPAQVRNTFLAPLLSRCVAKASPPRSAPCVVCYSCRTVCVCVRVCTWREACG